MKAQKLDIGIRASHTNWYCYPKNFGSLHKKVYNYILFYIDVGIFGIAVSICVWSPYPNIQFLCLHVIPIRGPSYPGVQKCKKEPPPGIEPWSLRLAGFRATISTNLDFQMAPHQLHCLNLFEESWFLKKMFWESSMFWNFLVWRILICPTKINLNFENFNRKNVKNQLACNLRFSKPLWSPLDSYSGSLFCCRNHKSILS